VNKDVQKFMGKTPGSNLHHKGGKGEGNKDGLQPLNISIYTHTYTPSHTHTNDCCTT